ncbi:MAG: signal peptidase II [Defluviitaleaceae bacterium]|nr:signal peptidase II [Defluviitaleaceae bacterium]
MNKRSCWVIFFVAVAVFLAADLALKIWSVANLQGAPNRVLIPGVLGLTYFENPGAFFGFLADFNARWPLAVMKTAILGGLLWYYNRLPLETRFWAVRVPIILIFAGGAGNLVDRVQLGVVRDMIQFLFINFPIWNLADAYVTVGVIALVFVSFFVVKDVPFP